MSLFCQRPKLAIESAFMAIESLENLEGGIRPVSNVWFERLGWVVVALAAAPAVSDRAALFK